MRKNTQPKSFQILQNAEENFELVVSNESLVVRMLTAND